MRQKMELFIEGHEGKSNTLYTDTAGKLTIGVGHNIEDNGISDGAAQFILREDIGSAIRDLYTVFPDFHTYGVARRIALTDMMFNLGLPRFRTFKRMIAAVRDDDWEQAATEALDSRWASQVGARATEDAEILRTNNIQEEIA